SLTDFTADGILPPINWATNGHGPGHEACDAYVEARNGKFVPIYGQSGQPFVCYPDNPRPSNLDNPYYRPLKPGEAVPAGSGTETRHARAKRGHPDGETGGVGTRPWISRSLGSSTASRSGASTGSSPSGSS